MGMLGCAPAPARCTCRFSLPSRSDTVPTFACSLRVLPPSLRYLGHKSIPMFDRVTPPVPRTPSLALQSDAAQVCPQASTCKEMVHKDTMI